MNEFGGTSLLPTSAQFSPFFLPLHFLIAKAGLNIHLKTYLSTTCRQKERKDMGKRKEGCEKESDREEEEGRWERGRGGKNGRKGGGRKRKEGKEKKRTQAATGNLS